MEEQKPRILVVDDTEDNLELLEFALKRKPIQLLRATSGKECLTVAAVEQPDIILLDILMPEMDGFETLKRLRADKATAKIPVIFLTAQRKDPDSIATGLALGAEQYLTKPIDTEELLVRTKMLIQLKKAEAELERTKADFMAMLVHDLRSPLIGIKSVIELLQEMGKGGTLGSDHIELLNSAHSSARKLLELVSDFLDISKYEAGATSFEKRPVPVTDFIDPVLRQMELQFKQKNINVVRNIPAELPRVHVDAAKTQQVVMNLLSNALKFTKSGGTITLDATVETAAGEKLPLETGKKFVRVSVTDTGIGIPKEELPFLFERYKQASSAKVVKQKGTGLGLAICKLIVEAQNGSVCVESEAGKQTTFSFTLPAVEA
jgi:two-component system sensor histidine kinase/response regulator